MDVPTAAAPVELDWDLEMHLCCKQLNLTMNEKVRPRFIDVARHVYNDRHIMLNYKALSSIRGEVMDGDRYVNLAPLLFPIEGFRSYLRMLTAVVVFPSTAATDNPAVAFSIETRPYLQNIQLIADRNKLCHETHDRLVRQMLDMVNQRILIYQEAKVPLRFMGAFEFKVRDEPLIQVNEEASRHAVRQMQRGMERCERLLQKHSAQLGLAPDVDLLQSRGAFMLLSALSEQGMWPTTLLDMIWPEVLRAARADGVRV